MEKLSRKQQQAWKNLVTRESKDALMEAGFDLQTDFYEVPIIGIMALKKFPYPNIRELLAAMYWGARGNDKEPAEKNIDNRYYDRHPQLIFHPDERLKVLCEAGCFKTPNRFYDLTMQQILSAIYYSPDYIIEYSQYYIAFYERNHLGQVLCFENRDDILKRYTPFSKESPKTSNAR